MPVFEVDEQRYLSKHLYLSLYCQAIVELTGLDDWKNLQIDKMFDSIKRSFKL